jgi:hypothetical protein
MRIHSSLKYVIEQASSTDSVAMGYNYLHVQFNKLLTGQALCHASYAGSYFDTVEQLSFK